MPLKPARPTDTTKNATPRGQLPIALRDVLDVLLRCRIRGHMCTREALERVTSTRSKLAVWQYIHRLRHGHHYLIDTVPCRDGDASKGGYHLITSPESIRQNERGSVGIILL